MRVHIVSANHGTCIAPAPTTKKANPMRIADM